MTEKDIYNKKITRHTFLNGDFKYSATFSVREGNILWIIPKYVDYQVNCSESFDAISRLYGEPKLFTWDGEYSQLLNEFDKKINRFIYIMNSRIQVSKNRIL